MCCCLRGTTSMTCNCPVSINEQHMNNSNWWATWWQFPGFLHNGIFVLAHMKANFIFEILFRKCKFQKIDTYWEIVGNFSFRWTTSTPITKYFIKSKIGFPSVDSIWLSGCKFPCTSQWLTSFRQQFYNHVMF